MKTKLLFLLLLLSLTSFAQTNLVPNGDFENWSASSQPISWYRDFTGLLYQSSSAQSGASSTSMELTGASTTSSFMNSTVFPVETEKTYRVTLYHKVETGTFTKLELSLNHNIFKDVLKITTDGTFSSSEWRKVEFDYTSTVTKNIEVDIRVEGSPNGRILVDNASVVALQYTAIPDPNFERKLIALGLDSGIEDGKVLTSSIQAETNLDVSNSNIADLTGIQDFTALTYLNCNTNALTSLDVSSNLKLESLQIQANQLTTLNVSKNTLLTSLSCTNNKLTSLDVSTLVSLKRLYCDSNKLATLNVDNNIALTDLQCSRNQLTDINVAKNTKLINFYCYTNLISNINVATNTELVFFMCNDNKLTSIDVSKNTKLEIFDCLDNKITKLDISKNPKITELACENNNLNYLNLKNGNNINLELGFSNFVNNPNLTCIQVDDVAYSNANWSGIKDVTANFNAECFSYTAIPDINFENKLIALGYDSGTPDGKVLTSKIDSITTIDLYYSNITDLTGIQDFTALTNLSCMSNKLSTLDLSRNLALTNLNAGYNKLTNIDLSNNVDLQYLSLSYNALTTLNISKNLKLTGLSCSSNQLTSIDVSNNKTLSWIWCSTNPITTLDLSKNTSLTSVLCSDSKYLTSINLKNGKNSTINLSTNSFDLRENPLLTCILVDNAIYSNDKWPNFKDTAASYSTVDCALVTAIPDVNFEDKLIALQIDKDGRNGSVLNSSISTITSLNVASSSIKDLTGIKGFTSLTTLNCSGNILTNLDLSQNPTLILVNCSNNTLTSLNLKNGNNTNFDLNSNFTSNVNLSCIQVDDQVYSNSNWAALKDAAANYNVDCTAYTLIPDSNFENKLIALEIDKDGKNGKVKTASVSKVTTLDLSNSNISYMTGIEDFTGLLVLECYSNNISSINVRNNKLLTKLSLHYNKLTSLDVTQNTKMFNLSFAYNQISTIDLSQNKDLHYLAADSNLLSTIDISSNTLLESIYCGQNNLTSLDVSNQPNLLDLNCILTNISKLDVSANKKLEALYFNDAKLTTIDLSNNTALKRINLGRNQLTTLDLSHNPSLELVFLEFNPLTSLNVQNGNNRNFILPTQTGKQTVAAIYTSFLGNTTLNCIKVDDPAYSNANWSKIKENSTVYSATCALGIEESVFDKVVMYPNPTKGEVNINNIALDKVTVYNSIGQLVKSFSLNSADTNNTVNLSGLPKGIYYVYLINQDAASAKKIIVE